MAADDGRPAVALGALTLGYLLVSTGEALLGPLFPDIRRDLGLGYGAQGSLTALMTVCIGLGCLAGGVLAPAIGHRRSMSGATAAVALGATVVGLSSGVGLLVVGLALVGLGAGAYFPASLVVVGSLYPRRRATAVAAWSTAFALGLAVAALAAKLVEHGDWRWGYGGLAIAAALTAAALLQAPVDLARSRHWGRPRIPSGRAFRRAVWIGSVATVGYYGVVLFLPTFLEDDAGLGVGAIAVFLVTLRVLGFPAKMLVGAAADRWGRGQSAIGVLLVMVASLAAAMLLEITAPLLLLLGVNVLAISTMFPISHTLLVEVVDPAEREASAAIGRASQLASGALGSLLIGWVAEATSLRLGMVVAVAFALSALPAAARLRPRHAAVGGVDLATA